MSTLFEQPDDHAEAPIRGIDELVLHFSAGEKPPDRHGIGVEFERLPVDRRTGRAVPYAAPRPGAPCVETILGRLAERNGWAPLHESGRIIALQRGGARVTLEPGAQVELSGSVHRTVRAAAEEIGIFLGESDAAAEAIGVAFLGLGCQPFTEPPGIGWVPKGRYRIMAPYLAKRGHLAHAMMKATAGCQFNLDFATEDDAMEKFRVAMAISSVVTALCANSPLARGQGCGFLTRRAHVWLHTDPDRCGLLPFALREAGRYRDYVEWALDVPMLFVVREGRWVEMTGRTFRDYLAGAGGGLTPTHGDWELHLTTLFPEVRLKRYIEVRGSDSASAATVVALAAFWKGILYDATARRRAWLALGDIAMEDRLAFQRSLVRQGLAARAGGGLALDFARELLDAAEGGLPPDERACLAPLRHLVIERRSTAAESLLESYRGRWNREPARLVEALSGPEPLPG